MANNKESYVSRLLCTERYKCSNSLCTDGSRRSKLKVVLKTTGSLKAFFEILVRQIMLFPFGKLFFLRLLLSGVEADFIFRK